MKHMLLGVVTCICFIPSLISSKNIEDRNSKQTSTSPQAFLQSIEPELKKPEYRQEILPNNFSYFIQLLEYGNKTKQSRAYIQSVFRLFGNMLKGGQYVNAYVFSDLLGKLPELLKGNFMLYKMSAFLPYNVLNDLEILDRFQQTVTTMMYTKFTSSYDQFKQDPEKFLDELSHTITQIAEEEVSIEQLRQTIIRFLETALNKLVWSPENKEKVWESVKTIAQSMSTLMEHNIIDDINDLDDLFWTLVHRFCFFIELTSAELPITFYEKIKKDIASQQLLLFELEEQESFIESKTDCLMRTVMTCEAKKRAHDKGIITL